MTPRRPRPERITQALDLAGLHGPDADTTLGGREPMVDQWEAGELVPTDTQLAHLADLAGVTVDWFYLPPSDMRGTMFLCRRSGPGKGCEIVHVGPDADVIPLFRDTLF